MAVTQLGTNQPQADSQRKDKQEGSGFTNIQKVVGANQGNKLGSTVSTGLQQTGQNIQKAVQGATERFGKQLEQGSLGEKQAQERQDLLDKAKQGQPISNQDVSQFSRFSSGQYTGPQGLENTDQLQAKASQGENLAKGVNTQGGRYGLLQQYVGSPKYTSGSLRTDSLLLGQAAPELRNAASGLKGVSRDVDRATTSAEGQAQQAQLQTQGFGQETNQLLNTTNDSIYNPIAEAQKSALERLPQSQQEYSNLLSNLGSFLKGGGKSNFESYQGPQDLNKLGLNQTEIDKLNNQYNALKNAGYSEDQSSNILRDTLAQNILNQDQLSNIGTFMNSNQASSLNALARLSGKDQTDFTNLNAYKPEDIELNNEASVSGLAKTKPIITKLQNDNAYLNKYVNSGNSLNAINGNNEARDFYISQDPELLYLYREYDQLKNSPYGGLAKGKLDPQQKQHTLFDLQNQIASRHVGVINKANSTIDENNKKLNTYGSMNNIADYQKYLNSNPSDGGISLFNDAKAQGSGTRN